MLTHKLRQKTPLWAHQLEVVEQFESQDCRLLRHDMGTGKTRTGVNMYRVKCAINKRALKLLVLAPKSVLYNWKKELTAHLHPDLSKHILVLDDNKKHLKLVSDAHILITNYDKATTEAWNVIKRIDWEFVILDESHKIKSTTGKTSKQVRELARRVKYRVLLSGTPILGDPMDIWPQLYVLDQKGRLVDENPYVFRARFCRDVMAGKVDSNGQPFRFKKFVLLSSEAPKLSKIINEFTSHKDKKDCLTLPEIVRVPQYVQLEGQLGAAYRQLERTFIASLPEYKDIIFTDQIVTQMLRLRELCVGVMAGDEKARVVKTQKSEHLADTIETVTPSEKMIIWTCFARTYPHIREILSKCKVGWAEIVGGQTGAQRQEQIESFTNDDSVRVMLASQQAGGTGVDGLQVASVAYYFSKSYSLGDDQQSEARIHRGGSERHEKITRIDVITEGTIEEDIEAALKGKAELSDVIINMRSRQ